MQPGHRQSSPSPSAPVVTQTASNIADAPAGLIRTGTAEAQTASNADGPIGSLQQATSMEGVTETQTGSNAIGGWMSGPGRQPQVAVMERLDSNLAATGSQRQDSFNSPMAAMRRPHVLLAVSGSVAAIKAPELARLLVGFADVKTVATDAGGRFFKESDLPVAAQPLHGDEEEWRSWTAIGDPIMHIELRRWADVLVIAPLSANTLAKLAQGMADSLLACVVRAWDFNKPLLVAPAMNTYMWESPFTSQHLHVLMSLGAKVIPPVSKKLACGDVGGGAMASAEDIAAHTRVAVNLA